MKKMKFVILCVFLTILTCQNLSASRQFVYVNKGRLYFPDGKELSLMGVNLQPCLSWEYNQRLKKAGIKLTSSDLKSITDSSLNEIQKMGANVIRCHITPIDFTDSEGNLVQNVRLDVLDYMVAEAAKRNIFIYITLLNHMNDADQSSSFLSSLDHRKRQPLIFDKQMVEKSKNYIKQLLNRTNPYSKEAYKSMTKIALWEILNEPGFSYYNYTDFQNSPYKDDYLKWTSTNKSGSNDKEQYSAFRKYIVLNYINDMYSTIRSTGAVQPVVWNCNWPIFPKQNADIQEATSQSKVEVVSFCNYPYNNSFPEKNNNLSDVDFSKYFNDNYLDENSLGWTLTSAFKNKAKVVYEYEATNSQNSTTYPIQALLFRALGAQVSAMWTYNMTKSAPYFSGTHFLSLTCTPQKAASFVVAHEIFDATPLYTAFNTSTTNEQTEKNFALSKEKNISVFANNKKLCYTGDITNWSPIEVSKNFTEIAGLGNSPLVKYNGTGMYFLNEKNKELLITLEPNSTWLSEHWLGGKGNKLVTKLDYSTANTLTILLDKWKKGPFVLYGLKNGVRVKMAELMELKEISIAPGDYIVVRK